MSKAIKLIRSGDNQEYQIENLERVLAKDRYKIALLLQKIIAIFKMHPELHCKIDSLLRF